MFASLAASALLAIQWLPFLAPPTPPKTPPTPRYQAVCSAPETSATACFAKVRTQSDGSVKAAATPKALPAGYSPAQLRAAYGATTAARSLAVITAYDNPRIKSDLDTYSSAYGLPVMPNCTTAAQTGCFAKLDQRGGTFYPFPNRGWAFEADLDVELAHAMCPGCRLTLVEASSSSIANLTTAVDRAVTVGAQVVSMSWGAGEFASELGYDGHFAPAGVSFVAASGDSGFGTSWPAASGHVIAAGGTTLTLGATGRTAEAVWNGTGSGCSLYETKPAWQTDTAGCARRTIADVSADADPATGAAIYSGYSPYGTGWFVVGGTSLSTPIIAALVAEAAPAGQAAHLANLYAALGSASLYDVVSGSNGSCSPAYLCHAGAGYDGPSGVGAPIGLAAF